MRQHAHPPMPEDTAGDRARLLRALRQGTVRPRAAGIPVADRTAPLPLSYGQRRLWALERIHGGGPAYVVCLTVKIRGRVDVDALSRAVTLVVRRHEALRTVFPAVDGEPSQVILDPDSLPEILGVRTAGEPEPILRRWAAEPFDLARGPMLKALLIEGEDERVLGLCAHHIAVDAWSMGLIQQEISTAYAAYAAGRTPEPPAAGPDYADYAAWQRSLDLDEQAGYWVERLRDAPDVLALPHDRPRTASPEFSGDEVRFRLGAALADRLRRLGVESGATTFMVLFAGFAALLGRYSGQSDVIVGVPVAGRERADLEKVVGFFANTLAVRAELGGEPGFRELLARVRAAALEAFAHQSVPFEMLVQRLAPQREFAHNPLFQVMFAFQNAPDQEMTLGEAVVEPFRMANDTAKFDLWLSMSDARDGGIDGVIEYDTALFDRATVERLAAALECLLTSACDRPDARVTELATLPAADRDAVLALGTGEPAGIPPFTVPELIARQGARRPQAVAVTFEGGSLTYRELEERAAALARRLRAMGAGPETRVAVVMRRSTELVVALLGILKAGAAYVPVDPDYPPERVRYMLADAAAPIAVTQPELRHLIDGPEVLELGPGAVVDGGVDGGGDGPLPAPDPDSLAYVIYTSGSTGRPKGAMIHHRGLVNRLLWMAGAYQVTEDDRILQKTPYSFDVSVWEFFLPLVTGATLVVAPPAAHEDPRRLAGLMAAEAVSIVHFVPAMLGVFLDQPGLPRLPELRLLVCSGEALPRSLAETALARLGARCENLYGPTEASIDVTAYTPGASPYETRCAAVPIGRPIENVRAHVLGPGLQPQQIGVIGELCLAGEGVGRGYLGRPGLTAERFVPAPFGPPGGYLYRTGDLARLLADGHIEFLGRLDHQMKVHGFRIEPGEIEAALLEHPGIRSAAVTATPDGGRLVAHVVRTGDEPAPDAAAVTRWTEVFDATYRGAEQVSGPDYAGWRSSFTGSDYAGADMAEWVDRTVEAILALRPRRILEIGCGTGLLAERLIRHVDSYVGTDISATAIAALSRRHVKSDRARFLRRDAEHVSDLGEFDVVVLNSVIQYFPGPDYLDRVLTEAARICAGVVFVGDVRSLPLLEAFHLAVLAGQAGAPMTKGEILERVAAECDKDRELVVDPRYFVRFAENRGLVADIRLKTGTAPTEMNVFRYDVLLRPGSPALARLRDLPGAELGLPHPGQAPLVEALRLLEEGPADEIFPLDGLRPGTPDAAPAGPGLTCHRSPSPGRPGRYDQVVTPAAVEGLISSEDGGDGPLTNAPAARMGDEWFAAELRERLLERLPDHMVPTEINVLAELPLTPSGKVDRTALRPRPAVSQAAYEPPRGQAEELLAKLAAGLLGVPRVGRNDDFFALGGESILALQLVNKARQAGVTITAQAVFRHPTIQGMAEAAASQADPPRTRPAGPSGRGRLPDAKPWRPADGVIDVYPLAPIQHEMLSAALEAAEPGLHTATVELSIDDAGFDEGAFAAAWQHVMERHPVLRTSFHWKGLLRPVQAVHAISTPPIDRSDLSGLPETEQDERLAAALGEERRRLLRLDQAPQWRIRLFKLGPGRYRAIMRFSYMLQDGWSFQNMQREFFAAYDACREGTAPRLPSPPAFGEHISWLSERDETADAAYWSETMKRFAGRTPLVEALGAPNWAGTGTHYDRVGLEMPPEVVAGLARVARERGVTQFTLLQGAWALVLSGLTGRETVTFGTVSAGRPEHLSEMAGMVGPFNNLLPVVVAADPGEAVTSWLRRLQSGQADMREHQFASLAQIREWAGLPWRTPLFDSYLVYENFPMDAAAGRRMESWNPGVGVTQTEHPIRVLFWPVGGLHVEISFYTRLFGAAAMRGLLAAYERVIRAVVAREDTPLAELRALVNPTGEAGVRS
ncbi:amino acid adenylation domain-containing protein [Nonomuraea sp. NPDC049725]|uniref:non-ribosomal peptide synthetase n=1 Tax=Nonomuraea sp. NPDC049725 TaxID=3154508 RepID=UPI0034306499